MSATSKIESKPKIDDKQIENVARILARQIDKEVFEKKYAPVKETLILVGLGVFLAASVVMPNLPLALKPFIKKNDEYEAWKRFNIPYLKRTLNRLEKQRLVEISEEGDRQIVKITKNGKKKILKFAIDGLNVEKPKVWDRKWRLVSYDIPKEMKVSRDVFRRYLNAWGFYPLHESAFLHAYSCGDQLEFLRQYLGVGGCVRIFTVTNIENDKLFRDFFGI